VTEEQRLHYRSAWVPFELQFLLEADPGVSGSVQTSAGHVFELRPGQPTQQMLAPPLPESMGVVYSVKGPSDRVYQIEARITQGDFTDHLVTRGTIPHDGSARHFVRLEGPGGQYVGASSPSAYPPLPGDPHIDPPPRPTRAMPPPQSPQSPAPPPPPPLAKAPPPPVATKPASAPSALPTFRRSPRSEPKSTAQRPEKGRFTVWFGTNREPLMQAGAIAGFSAERSGTVHYGWCRVAIPESHTIGSIGSSWWKGLITRTDDRLKIVKIAALLEAEYWQRVATELRARDAGERDAVVFLHGYNVSFEEAAIRAAQLGFDLGVSGLMAFYSWPSKGTLQGYPADEATIEASEGFIADFLTNMAARSGASRVHIIAHSMGNRGLLRAIDRIATAAAERARTPFDQIVLAAADVDQDTFRRLSVAYQRVARRTTMYVCSKDRAVEASHWLHDFPRAGLTPPVLVLPGIDTINVSNLDLTLIGHGYVAEARELLTDIHTLLREGTPPAKRFGLRQMAAPDGDYWTVGR